ncbi:MAG: NADPH-dependent FMN reductase [Thermomicrobiales bacterium]
MNITNNTILAICGSLRKGSYNAALLDLAARVAPDLRFVGRDLAGQLPLFNPDLEENEPAHPPAVREFRRLADAADAVVIVTPEYASGPSGVTKNAIDWLIGSDGLGSRPTVLMSASPGQSGGLRGQAALLPTLTFLAVILVDTVSVGRVSSKVDASGAIVDAATIERVRLSMDELRDALRYSARRQTSLPVN